MKFIALLVLACLFPVVTHAQTVSASATISWTAPTQATDGSALTGAQAITSYQVWVSTSTIPTTTTAVPTATLTATATTTTQTISATAGGTIFTRVKACNAAGCSDFSNEGTKVIVLSRPNPPTNVTVTIVITP